jgi:hypothetical protein
LSRRSAVEKYKQRSVKIYVTLYLESSFGRVTFCDFKMFCLPMNCSTAQHNNNTLQ